MRAYLEHGLAREPQPVKLWYVAPMFRYARAQRGRYREHWQFGVESLGSDDPAVDAEVIALQAAWFGELGLLDGLELRAQLDRRPDLPPGLPRLLVAYLERFRSELSEDSQARLDDQSAAHLRLQGRGRPEDRERRAAHHRPPLRRLRRALRERARLPRRARASPTASRPSWCAASTTTSAPHGSGCFPSGGSQAGTISGGGRYDGLAEQIGGERVPGVGFGCGTERVVLALEAAGVEPPVPRVDWFCACEDDAARPALHALLERARARGLSCQADLAGRSLKGQLRHAERMRRARRHRLPRRRRRAWHRQARRRRDRLRRCRRLRRAERARRVSAYRDMLCGEPRAEHAGRELTLSGWVGGRRDHGGLVFIDLRDRTGLVQLVMDPERSPEAHAAAQALRLECVVRARGELVPRSEATRNDAAADRRRRARRRRARAALLERGAAVPARRRGRRRGAAHPPPLPRPAAAANAGIAGHSHARRALDPPLPGRAGLPRPRDADDDARDARGRTRLRDPVPPRARARSTRCRRARSSTSSC